MTSSVYLDSSALVKLVIGERESEAGEATVKRLDDGTQRTVPLTDVAQFIE